MQRFIPCYLLLLPARFSLILAPTSHRFPAGPVVNFDLRAKEETGREGEAWPLAHSHTERSRPLSNISSANVLS